MVSALGRRRPPAAFVSRQWPVSRPGRWYGPACLNVLLLGAEDLVAGIAETRKDITFLVQAFINGGCVDRHVRMGLEDFLDALGRGYQNQGPDLGAAGFLEQVDGGNHGAAGSEHGIDDHGHSLIQLTHQFFQVGAGLECFLVADLAHDADPGYRDQAQHTVHHAQACPQDGYDGDLFAADLFHLYRACPAIDGFLAQGEILGGFIGQ